MDENQLDREWMVQHQIAGRGIDDERVLNALRKVPRHLFVPSELRGQAYSDHPLQIGSGQTISQPYIVGLMTALLDVQPDHKVLDVGTGSGYQAAVLGELAEEVHTIERYPALAKSAEKVLRELGYDTVYVHVGDGTQGYAPCAPYDRIIVGAAAPSVPDPLLNQLAVEGRLVLPVGRRYSQRLEIWEKTENGFDQSSNIPVIFVPLVGENGWDAD
jgi:protein-L-isoaspartate(D-aspartate) O-methyltransferase